MYYGTFIEHNAIQTIKYLMSEFQSYLIATAMVECQRSNVFRARNHHQIPYLDPSDCLLSLHHAHGLGRLTLRDELGGTEVGRSEQHALHQNCRVIRVTQCHCNQQYFLLPFNHLFA